MARTLKDVDDTLARVEQWASDLSTWYKEKGNPKKAHDWMVDIGRRLDHVESGTALAAGNVPPPPPPPKYPS